MEFKLIFGLTIFAHLLILETVEALECYVCDDCPENEELMVFENCDDLSSIEQGNGNPSGNLPMGFIDEEEEYEDPDEITQSTTTKRPISGSSTTTKGTTKIVTTMLSSIKPAATVPSTVRPSVQGGIRTTTTRPPPVDLDNSIEHQSTISATGNISSQNPIGANLRPTNSTGVGTTRIPITASTVMLVSTAKEPFDSLELDHFNNSNEILAHLGLNIPSSSLGTTSASIIRTTQKVSANLSADKGATTSSTFSSPVSVTLPQSNLGSSAEKGSTTNGNSGAEKAPSTVTATTSKALAEVTATTNPTTKLGGSSEEKSGSGMDSSGSSAEKNLASIGSIPSKTSSSEKTSVRTTVKATGPDSSNESESSEEDLRRQGRSANWKRQAIFGRPACYIIHTRVNNTSVVKRGCTKMINANDYMTCQALHVGVQAKECQICSVDRCNKFVMDYTDWSSSAEGYGSGARSVEMPNNIRSLLIVFNICLVVLQLRS